MPQSLEKQIRLSIESNQNFEVVLAKFKEITLKLLFIGVGKKTEAEAEWHWILRGYYKDKIGLPIKKDT